MNRYLGALVATLIALASIGAGVGAWRWARSDTPRQPQISVYSAGRLARVGPYLSCDVQLRHCEVSDVVGELPVNRRDPVQLSVDGSIARAPWRLIQWYADPADALERMFPPGSTLAVTIPTVDPQRGPLSGLAVQLLTLAVDTAGELHELEHAEWSVRTVWSCCGR